MGALTVVGLALVLSVFIVRSEEGTETCGARKLTASELIAYGYKARAGAWPWHGAMFHRHNLGVTKYACGVTILTEQFVLTAAHCTYDGWQRLPADRVFIKLGFSNLDSPEDHVRQFDVDSIIRHEEYDKETFENDIALLKLYSEIAFNSYIQPVCLWQGDTQLSKIVSKEGFVVGWGLHEGFSLPKYLLETTMPILSSKKCWESDRWHYSKYYFESKTFCAGRLNGTHVSHGDSGSGFYLQLGVNWILRGIVSNAKTNPFTLNVKADSYAIFTDVANYLEWIKTKVPGIPYLAADTKLITETEFNSDANLLDLKGCGKVTYLSQTQEEGKDLVSQYPWEAVIKAYDSAQNFQLGCVGILIHPNFVIGFAACFSKKVQQIFAWINDFDSIDNSSTRIRIEKTFRHPHSSFRMFAKNIAIAKLERPATVDPICLPILDPLKLPDATQLHTVGVHLHDETRYFQNVTQLVDLEVCQEQLAEIKIHANLTEGHACSTIFREDRDFMYYLVSAPWQRVSKERQYFLAAFSPYAIKGTSLKTPTVFINVAYFSKWIRETIEQN